MSKTYIVDGNSLLFRAYYATAYTGKTLSTSTGIPINAIISYHNMIKQIKAEIANGDHLFISFDTGGKTFRKEEFGEYKAQRKKAPDDLIAQMPIAREMLDAMSIFHDEKEGYEGDDLAGSMVKEALKRGDEVVLFTSDKDFLQLLSFSDKVSIRFLKKGLKDVVVYTANNLHSLIGLYPDQITDYKGLAGDTSDNYKGIPGIGEKKALALLNANRHLEDVIAYCKDNQEGKINSLILEHKDEALFFKKLATIETELDMSEDYSRSLHKPYNREKLAAFYRKYQLTKFLSAIDKMKDIECEDRGLPLFDFAKEVDREKKLVVINSFAEIKGQVKVFLIESNDENENKAEIINFVFADDNQVYALPLLAAKNDDSFNEFLKQNKEITVFDNKSISVLLKRNDFCQLNGVAFDFLLATYLHNSDIGQDISDIFSYYSIPYVKGERWIVKLASLISVQADKLKAELEQNGEIELLKDVEIPLSSILADMEIEGFPIDRRTLSEIDEEYKKTLVETTEEIYKLAGEEFNINSPKQLERILFEKLAIGRNKGEKGTGIEVLKAHYNDHPIIPLIVKQRKYTKLISAYTSSLPSHIFPDSKIHAIYNQALTSTGRLSMSEPNLQNISIRDEDGKAIRRAFFYPNREYYLLSLDYSQIELRVLAHVADIKALKEIIKSGEDIHAATASAVFQVPIAEVTKEMRRRAKAVNFGIVYGISSYGLANQLEIPTSEAASLIKQFKQTFLGLDEFQNATIQMAKERGYVETLLHRRRYFPDINSSNRALRSFSERAAVNAVIQGSAADLIKVAMIKVQDVLKGHEAKLILTIHDELIFKIPAQEVEELLPKLALAMEKALELSIPLKVDGTYALTWYEAH